MSNSSNPYLNYSYMAIRSTTQSVLPPIPLVNICLLDNLVEFALPEMEEFVFAMMLSEPGSGFHGLLLGAGGKDRHWHPSTFAAASVKQV